MPISWSPKQEQIIMAPFDHTIDWLEGTPRSGKTASATMRFARHLIKSRDMMHLVVGYSSEQAYRLIFEGDGLGLLHIFKQHGKVKYDNTGPHLEVECPNGIKKVYWKGGGKTGSKKAITGLSLGSVYFCEIDLLNLDMVQECLRRTYAAKDRWHIADLNPPSPMHPCITNVLEIQDCRFLHWTCHDNPILTEERLEEIKTACSKSPFLYKRDWLGERAIPEGVIYWMFDKDKHIIDGLPRNARKIEMFFAGDGGTTDATSIGCYIVAELDGKYQLYRMGNWYYDGGQKAMSTQAYEIVNRFIPYMREKCRMHEVSIYIDPACKALRLEIEKLGLMTQRADNNAHDHIGNVAGLMCGIEMLQSGIHDDRFYLCEDETYGTDAWLREVGLYCVNDHGIPVDAYNHAMDETRYAYNYFAKQYGVWG